MGRRSAAWLATVALAAGAMVAGCEGPDRRGLEVGAFERAAPADADDREPGGRRAITPGGASTAVEPEPSPARRGERSVHPESPTPLEPREDEADPEADDPERGGEGDDDSAAAPVRPDNPASNPRSEDRSATEPLILDAMVGQVNGKPIYAGEIFREIGLDQIERLGRTQSRDAFRYEMMELIASDLRRRVQDALILREAERDLSEREREGLRHHMRREREKLLARWGGVLAYAEQGVMRQTGRTLDEELEARRQALLAEKYIHEKLFPRINVTHRDVQRYYHDNYERFNTPPTATVRVIVVGDGTVADDAAAALDAGEPFEAVAERYSEVRAGRGGLMPSFPLSDDALNWPELNDAVRELRPGEHSDRIEIAQGYGWVMLDDLEGGSSRTLEEAYLEIERDLNAQRFNRLSRQYIEDLMASGSYTPVEQMASVLLEVAMARFAQPR